MSCVSLLKKANPLLASINLRAMTSSILVGAVAWLSPAERLIQKRRPILQTSAQGHALSESMQGEGNKCSIIAIKSCPRVEMGQIPF